MTAEPSRTPDQHTSDIPGNQTVDVDGRSYAGADHGSSWASRHSLSIYFVLAFLLSWLPWPLVLLNADSSPMVPFGPLIAAVVASLLGGGMRGLARLLAQLGRWRAAPPWYLTALLVPLLVPAIAAASTLALGGAAAGGQRQLDWAQIAAVFASTLLLVGLFEEVGWRGYALPRLQQRTSSLRAALLIGVIWASWHLPELVSEPTGQRPVIQFLILVIAQSLFFTWLYVSTTAGLALVIISHAAVDTAAQFILPQFTGDSYQLIWWCQTALWIIVAIFAAARLRRKDPH